MHVIITGIVSLMVAVIFILILDRMRMMREINRYGVIYVDTAGVSQNPPNMIETLAGKTLNIRVNDKHIVKINQLSWFENVYHIERIVGYYAILSQFISDIGDSKLSAAQASQKRIAIVTIMQRICGHIYEISKRWVPDRRAFKKALFARFMSDDTWSIELTMNILDYWQLTKKKLQLLATGTTLRRMYGEGYIPNLLNVDGSGKISVRPRYEAFTNTSHN